MSVNIHGKQYITVAERVQQAHTDDLNQSISITTEVLQFDPIVVIKATVQTKKGVFTGISAANPDKAIEKQSPFEVAETSAVGRALGFAGYGIIEGIASADEVNKATYKPREVKIETNCEHLNTKDLQAKGGVHKGKWFKKCMDCGKIIGKIDAPITTEPTGKEWEDKLSTIH